MKYLYGPVRSRRLGFSLGLSLTPYKVCNFDCLYCQLGKTTLKINKRQEYIKIKDIVEELKEFLKNSRDNLDYITLSGFGEPTLNLNIKKLIKEIKKLTHTPIALITNASLIGSRKLRNEILEVDLIVPSLNSYKKDIFDKINRPSKNIALNKIITGLINLRKEFKGKIYLEIMLVRGFNDKISDIKKFKEITDKINPDKIQLNTPVRSTTEPNIKPPDKKTLLKIKQIFGKNCEII